MPGECAKEVVVFDDLFAVNKRRLRAIAEGMSREGPAGLQLSCLVRSDLLDQEMIDLLRAGRAPPCIRGRERKRPHARAYEQEGDRGRKPARIDLLAANGFQPTISLIAGYPGETREDSGAIAPFAERNRGLCAIIDIYPCIPLPGTELWNWFARARAIDPMHFDWRSLNVHPATADWSRYHLLADAYEKQTLIDVVQWNEAEKASRASRLEPPPISLGPRRPLGVRTVRRAVSWCVRLPRRVLRRSLRALGASS